MINYEHQMALKDQKMPLLSSYKLVDSVNTTFTATHKGFAVAILYRCRLKFEIMQWYPAEGSDPTPVSI